MTIRQTIKRFIEDDSGQDIVEYSLLLVLIAAACIIVLSLTGKSIVGVFQRITAALDAAPVGSGSGGTP